jgi:hypothetical protein
MSYVHCGLLKIGYGSSGGFFALFGSAISWLTRVAQSIAQRNSVTISEISLSTESFGGGRPPHLLDACAAPSSMGWMLAGVRGGSAIKVRES